LQLRTSCHPAGTITSLNAGEHIVPARQLLLNYFKARKQFSSGVVEGLNNKAKVTMRRSYGFRTFRILELALYHSLGKLPEPELTHEFF
jgi:transposase